MRVALNSKRPTAPAVVTDRGLDAHHVYCIESVDAVEQQITGICASVRAIDRLLKEEDRLKQPARLDVLAEFGQLLLCHGRQQLGCRMDRQDFAPVC